jgi:hypothetical protein
MPEREFEMRHLALADRHISRAEQIVTEAGTNIERLRRNGYDVELLERALEVHQHSLQTMYEHRDIIIRTIRQIDRGLV